MMPTISFQYKIEKFKFVAQLFDWLQNRYTQGKFQIKKSHGFPKYTYFATSRTAR